MDRFTLLDEPPPNAISREVGDRIPTLLQAIISPKPTRAWPTL
jgi:hypothetical protein